MISMKNILWVGKNKKFVHWTQYYHLNTKYSILEEGFPTAPVIRGRSHTQFGNDQQRNFGMKGNTPYYRLTGHPFHITMLVVEHGQQMDIQFIGKYLHGPGNRIQFGNRMYIMFHPV